MVIGTHGPKSPLPSGLRFLDTDVGILDDYLLAVFDVNLAPDSFPLLPCKLSFELFIQERMLLLDMSLQIVFLEIRLAAGIFQERQFEPLLSMSNGVVFKGFKTSSFEVTFVTFEWLDVQMVTDDVISNSPRIR